MCVIYTVRAYTVCKLTSAPRVSVGTGDGRVDGDQIKGGFGPLRQTEVRENM